MNVFTIHYRRLFQARQRKLLLRPNYYMFLRDGVDFNIPFIVFFVVVCLDKGHLLLLYT